MQTVPQQIINLFNQPVFSLSNVEGLNCDESGLPYKRLKAYEGESFKELNPGDRDSFLTDFCEVFRVSKSDVLSTVMSPKRAITRISRLRAGQPDPELFFSLSPMTEKLTKHLEHEINTKNGSVKFIIGDRGMGKTTLAQLIEDQVAHCNQPISNFTSGLSSTLSANSLFHSMFMSPAIIDSVIRGIRSLPDDKKFSNYDQVFEKTEYAPILKSLIAYALESKEESISELSSEFSLVTSLWMVAKPSKRLAIKNFLKPANGLCATPVSPDNLTLPTFAKTWLAFIHTVNVYPIVIVDEFEAYLGLFPQQRLKLLDYLRMIADLLWSPEHAGMCLFLTTRDGFNIIRNDPALYSRFGANSNSMLSGQWKMDRLNKWDTDKAKSLFRQLYECAALSDDIFYKDSLKNSQSLSGFENIIDDILASNQSPRAKVRGIIEAYDCCADDIEFIKSKISRRINDGKVFDSPCGQHSDKDNLCPLDSNLLDNDEFHATPDHDQDKNLNSVFKSNAMPKDEIEKIQATLEGLLKSMKKRDLSSDEHDDDWLTMTSNYDDPFSEFDKDNEIIQRDTEFEELLKNLKSIIPNEDEGMIARFVPSFFKKERANTVHWPKELLIGDKPLLVLTSSYPSTTCEDLKELLKPETSYSKSGALYSSYRDNGGLDYIYEKESFARLVHLPYCQSNSPLIITLKKLLCCSEELGGLPVGFTREANGKKTTNSENEKIDTAKELAADNSKKRIQVDVLSSLSMMRRFAYTFIIANGYFIKDALVDQIIIDCAKLLLPDDIYPSRQGVFFYFDGKLESISTYIP